MKKLPISEAVSGIGVGLLFGVILLGLWSFRRMRGSAQKDPYRGIRDRGLFEDEAVFVEAEKTEQAAPTYQMIPIRQYSSAEGYNPGMVLDRIAFLGSRGVAASYQSSFLEGIHIYTLLVREYQREEANEALNESE